MKKKVAALLLMTLVAISSFCMGAFADKPDVELMYIHGTWYTDTSIRGEQPIFFYRNNTNKNIKYIEWYVTAYNRVGDPAIDMSSGVSTKKFTTIGPVLPFQLTREGSGTVETKLFTPNDSPFRYYKNTAYYVAIGNNFQPVYQDIYNNFFVQPNSDSINSCTYLTEDEIENAMFSEWCQFDNNGWNNSTVRYIRANEAVVTYMDGSTETLTDFGSKYRSMSLQNRPFMEQLVQYQAVYNYQDYLNCNPDLAAQFGANQKALFEHFVTSGMKEGRQGSAQFNLNTYKANNPDLVAFFGDDNVKYYEHYISQGKSEGRIAA